MAGKAGESAGYPIYASNIVTYENFKNLCWAEAKLGDTPKYLGKYVSHTSITEPQSKKVYNNVIFDGGVRDGEVSVDRHPEVATIFIVPCKQSGGRRRNRKTIKKSRKNRRSSRRN